MAERAGLLVRRAGELLFVPAEIAHSVVSMPRLTRLPWDTLQMALVGGEIVPVLELGEPSGVLLVCEVEGQALGLSGLLAERVSVWPEQGLGVLVDGRFVPTLDTQSLRPKPIGPIRERIPTS